MSEGVEWAMHSCVNLSYLDSDEAMTAARLAAFYELPPAYLNKQLQALSRAGILSSTPGLRGGFRLARPLERITLLDVVTAIEGPGEAFRCEQVMRKGPVGREDVDYRKACFISQAMRRAEMAYRKELAAQTLADIRAKVERHSPGAPEAAREWFARRRS
ncbi:Rrf2 family transcriptional regulator [Nonomuraea sp. NPDC004580]|uniref:RrF2 family transcriptional regulator n=1 Tax=Nonomuraea sp. NPDC004580 TaxID=3154552 RepID=UPI0033B48064